MLENIAGAKRYSRPRGFNIAGASAVPTPLPPQNNKRTDKPAAVVAAGGVEATRGGKVVAIPGVVGGTAVETVAGSGVVPVQRQLYDEVHSKFARIGLQQCLQCFDAVGWAAGRASGL